MIHIIKSLTIEKNSDIIFKMQLFSGIELVDLGVFLSVPKILIIGDMHIGYEEYLHEQGVLVPKTGFKELSVRIEKIVNLKKPKTIIINGDIKHEFGKISNEEWRNTLRLIDFLSKKAKLVLLKGNHDNILGPIARKRDVEISDYFVYKNIYVCHGHKIPVDSDFKKAKTIIIGHEHPAISIDDGIRRETFKCFLFGKYKNKKLVVVPSMHLLSEGTNVLKEKLLSPFLKNINDFKVFVAGDKIYDFGKVKQHY